MGIPPHRYMTEASASWWWRWQCERLALGGPTLAVGGAVGVQLGQEVPLLVVAQSEKNARAHGVGVPTNGLPPRSSGVARPQSALTGVGARLMKQQLEAAAAAGPVHWQPVHLKLLEVQVLLTGTQAVEVRLSGRSLSP